ncbi:4-hydroxy-3-methylbut-2-enyl diphosphate reductase, partial [bacterium]|nr:4-hydroxy-3-methylbut-2-enyl diphosphate reductase [bacterium]
LAFNTICDATQERQDAMLGLVEETLDVMVVIGGFNSSNTTHLQEIAIERAFPPITLMMPIAFDGNCIQHKPLKQDITTTENWLPPGKIVVGVTSGASTPDKAVEETIQKILDLKASPAMV